MNFLTKQQTEPIQQLLDNIDLTQSQVQNYQDTNFDFEAEELLHHKRIAEVENSIAKYWREQKLEESRQNFESFMKGRVEVNEEKKLEEKRQFEESQRRRLENIKQQQYQIEIFNRHVKARQLAEEKQLQEEKIVEEEKKQKEKFNDLLTTEPAQKKLVEEAKTIQEEEKKLIDQHLQQKLLSDSAVSLHKREMTKNVSEQILERAAKEEELLKLEREKREKQMEEQQHEAKKRLAMEKQKLLEEEKKRGDFLAQLEAERLQEEKLRNLSRETRRG